MEQYKQPIILLIIALLSFLGQSTYSQNKINGKIVDAGSRQPLEFATVAEGRANGNKTTTDHYGNFSITSKATIETILISSAGYTATIVKTEGQTELKID